MASNHTALYRSQRNVKKSCDLMQCHPLQVTEHNHMSSVWGQGLKRFVQDRRRLVPFQLLQRVGGTGILDRILQFLGQAISRGPARTAIPVNEQIASNAQQPAAETTCLGMETVQRLVDLDKHILGQIFSICAAFSETVTQVIYAECMGPDKVLPRNLVSLQTVSDQLPVNQVH